MMEKRVPIKFKPLYMHQKNNKLFYVFHGGRGGGKSWEIADFLLIEVLLRSRKSNLNRKIKIDFI